jgi:hypothetical protein
MIGKEYGMKQGSYRTVCFIFLAFIAVVLAFGDEAIVNLQSRDLDLFDGSNGYTWRVEGSKFSTKTDADTFPKITQVGLGPTAIRVADQEQTSLGVWGRFDRQGYNWIDIYPVAADGGDDAGPAEIPIPGRVKELDVWVWGSNLNYTLEVYIRDYTGIVHVLNLGSLAFEGWKDLRVAVPSYIPQIKRVLPRLTSLTLVKFRLWTPPSEQVNNFYVYFNHLKVLTDIFEHRYDGDELADPKRVQELWAASSNN